MLAVGRALLESAHAEPTAVEHNISFGILVLLHDFGGSASRGGMDVFIGDRHTSLPAV